MPLQVEHLSYLTNNIRLHVVQAGPADGEVVMFLHGFPEFWYAWHHQVDYFSKQGYRVWAPDQRGYNISEKPTDIDAYTLDKLADDVVGLIKQSGQERISLVGHDFGGVVAWWVALKYPHLLKKLAILNTPHPIVMTKALRTERSQLLKSWYIFALQIPGIPEQLLRLINFAILIETMKRTSKPGTFSKSDYAAYRAAWGYSRSLKSMLHWYRALVQKQRYLVRPDSYEVQVPTLILWGKDDSFFSLDMAQPSVDLCIDGQLVLFDDTTHWIQHEKPAQVNQHLHDFFAGKQGES